MAKTEQSRVELPFLCCRKGLSGEEVESEFDFDALFGSADEESISLHEALWQVQANTTTANFNCR